MNIKKKGKDFTYIYWTCGVTKMALKKRRKRTGEMYKQTFVEKIRDTTKHSLLRLHPKSTVNHIRTQ